MVEDVQEEERKNNLIPPFDSGEWRPAFPRADISPRFASESFDGDRVLSIAGVTGASFGSWSIHISSIVPGISYQFAADYRIEAIGLESGKINSTIVDNSVSVIMIITWMDDENKWLRREYVDERSNLPDGWNRLTRMLMAPIDSSRIAIDMTFRWSAAGKVMWANAKCCAVQLQQRRVFKAATTYINPNVESRGELSANLQQIVHVIDLAGEQNADIVCIPETMLNRYSGHNLETTAYPLSNPYTDVICDKARQYRMYIVFTLHERDGNCIYNTAVLIDREGTIAGIYRKTHLALIEGEHGITPGNDYPVFQTDFGKIGMLICWDMWFPEAARLLRLQGAEILFVSTAGNAPIQTLARALDNGMYVVVAGVHGSKPSRIVNPHAEIIGELTGYDDGDPEDQALVVEVDLNHKFDQFWLSVGPAQAESARIYVNERRPDTYGGLLNGFNV